MRVKYDDVRFASLAYAVAAVAGEYEDSYIIPLDRHRRSQLIYAISGVMTVRSTTGMWVLPANRAVWIPQDTDHEVRMSGHVSMRTLYIAKEWSAALPPQVAVRYVSPLLRELIKEAVQAMSGEGTSERYERLVEVINDPLRSISRAAFHLPVPADDRLRSVTEPMLRGEGEGRSMREWAKVAGASVRNLRRLFMKETGMSFVKWRRQARLMEAVRQLAAQTPVTIVALDVGYESTSAFISAFKREFGQSPRQYLQPAETSTDLPRPTGTRHSKGTAA